LDVSVLVERLKSAKRKVCFLSIWLSNQPNKIKEQLIELSNRGVEIQALQADPNSEICTIRALSQKALFPEESTFQPNFISRIINSNINYFKKLNQTHNTNIEVRMFDLLPPFSLKLIDDTAFIRFTASHNRLY
jgi:hypothetical protein